MNYILIFSFVSGLVALGFGAFLIAAVLKQSKGRKEAEEIAKTIEEGAKSYLKRQYRTIFYVTAVFFSLLWYFFGWHSAFGFLIGAAFSALAGYVGMMVSVKTNFRVTAAAQNSLVSAFKIAFKGGSVTGFMVVGLGLLSLTLFYWIIQDLKSLVALGFGASLISVFARLGGGIYTKGADVGADLVGKIEAGIPEDDPRNPAVIADNVGDNVGDCAGMAADLFETFVVTVIAAMLIGSAIFPANLNIILFPLALGGLSIFAFIAASFFATIKDEKSIMKGLYKILGATVIILVILFYPLSFKFFGGSNFDPVKVFWSLIIGLVATVLIVIVTDYYTSKRFRPVITIAKNSTGGPGANLIAGLAISMESTFLPILIIVLGIFISFSLLKIYGIALAAMGMLSLAGVIVAIDSFGPITDNAGGIAQMSGAPENVRKITDALDSVGNTTKAITKGYAVVSAGISALVLFSSYIEEISFSGLEKINFDLANPYVLVGLFLGASLPYLFSSFAMLSVGRTAKSVVEEVKRQFREIQGIMERKNKPNYSQAVDIVTKAALKQMIVPSILPLVFTVFVGFVFGPIVLGGFLIGSIISGVFLAISMTVGGGAWDNAKKHIEEGNHGGKGSDTHKAAVVGDTVGDSYKDTAGPAINPMIKVVNIIALLISRFIV